MAKVFHRNASGCSFGGQTFEKGDDGAFDVPAEALEELAHHGFVTDPKLAAAGPDAGLVKDATDARTAAEHAKVELARITAEREVLVARIAALESDRDAKLAELQARLDDALARIAEMKKPKR